MKTISTSELHSKKHSLVRSLEQGKSVRLTHRGHKLGQIYPEQQASEVKSDDPIYTFYRHATAKAEPLSDRDMDRLIYGG